MLLACLVDDQVAVIHGLHAEIIEVQVCGGIERRGDLGHIIVEKLWIDAVDLDRALEIGLETTAMGFLESVHTVANDVPIKNLLIDIGKEHASGKFREIGITLNQRFGVQNDRLLKIGALHLRIE